MSQRRNKGTSDNQLVWCVVADEPGVLQVKDGYVTEVTAEYQREYPELQMSKQECDAVPH
jgi:hypothetical protein